MSAPALLALLAFGGAGAAAGRLVRLPMWPLTGALAGAGAAHLLGVTTGATPGWLSVAGQLLVGCAVGSTVGRGFFGSLRRVTVSGTVVATALIALGAAAGAVFALAGLLDLAPALLGSIPGGVGEMVGAAAALDSDSALVAGMHLVRLVVVLLALPWLLRWARGLRGGRD